MKKIIFLYFVLNIFNLNSNLYECLNEAEVKMRECSYESIKKYACEYCVKHYVMTSRLEDEVDGCCKEKIREALEQCGKARSDALNECIQDFCLDPWTDCPSCSMDF